MRIIAKSKIVDYYTNNPDAETALEDWYQKTKKAEWTCFADMKKTFNSVDNVGNPVSYTHLTLPTIRLV